MIARNRCTRFPKRRIECPSQLPAPPSSSRLRLARRRDRAQVIEGRAIVSRRSGHARVGGTDRGTVEQHQPAASSRTGARFREGRGSQPKLQIIGASAWGSTTLQSTKPPAAASGHQRSDYCFEEVADHSVGMLLSFTARSHAFRSRGEGRRWEPSTARLRRMSTLTVGIVGYGRIGRSTAQKLNGFGARVLAYTRSPHVETGRRVRRARSAAARLGCGDRAHSADCRTKHLLNRERFASMKRGAFLVNVSRGAVVETNALIEALQSGQLGWGPRSMCSRTSRMCRRHCSRCRT